MSQRFYLLSGVVKNYGQKAHMLVLPERQTHDHLDHGWFDRPQPGLNLRPEGVTQQPV